MSLEISNSITLPDNAVTQTFGCIGRRGAGKTYLAGVLAEQMLNIRAQVIVIDPVGNWYGLRVAADGKSKGKDIFVIGGDHGDIPITPESGAKIAKVLVEKTVSAVLDISTFRQGERKRFAADFGEEFFHLKKSQRSAVHLFIEEAQLFIPQRCGPEEARMLGAFENIVRLGRNYGIGATCISQRPQSVNKEVLSQIECLCVLQVNGTHERKALEDWVQEAGADRKLVGELPGLGRGEGYVWSPSWLRVFKKVHFAKKTTFDASATPEVGRSVRTALLSSVDVEKLKADLTVVIQQAEADDPKALRRRIAQLEREVVSGHKGKAGIDEGEHNRQINELNSTIDAVRLEGRSVAANGVFHLKKLEEMAASFIKELANARGLMEGCLDKRALAVKSSTPASPPKPPIPKVAIPPARQPERNGHIELSGPERRILNAIAWLESIGVDSPEQTAVAFLAGYTYGGGGFNNPRGRLNQRGLLEYVAGDRIRLTEDGRGAADPPPQALSNEELHRMVMERLPGPEQRLLNPLLEVYPDAMSNDDLAAAARYVANSGGFNNPRGRLRTLGLVEYPQPGMVRARDVLFPL